VFGHLGGRIISGPAFGQGHDICAGCNGLYYGLSLDHGYAARMTYGALGDPLSIVNGAAGSITFDRIDVFTIEASPVPEPGSVVLIALAGAGLLSLYRRRK